MVSHKTGLRRWPNSGVKLKSRKSIRAINIIITASIESI